jgi:two-component system, NarL family, invasion response regulator UvrY
MSTPTKPRILIADDHSLVRDSLPYILQRTLPDATYGKATNSAEVFTAIENEAWDIVILDLGLPGDREVETLTRLRLLRPELPILVLSMFPEKKMGAIAIRAGASGYLCKTADVAVIAHAVQETLAGKGFISPALEKLLATTRTPARGLSSLSDREVEVLILLGEGFSLKEIASKLDITVSSIGTYRARLLEKLHLQTSADLVRYVIENRVI